MHPGLPEAGWPLSYSSKVQNQLWKPQAVSWSWGQHLMANLIWSGYVVLLLKSFVFDVDLLSLLVNLLQYCFYILCFVFWPQACGISAPGPGLNPCPAFWKVSFNHWTWEVPGHEVIYSCSYPLSMNMYTFFWIGVMSLWRFMGFCPELAGQLCNIC